MEVIIVLFELFLVSQLERAERKQNKNVEAEQRVFRQMQERTGA